MTKKVTSVQSDTLEYIKAYIEKNGYPPSITEIASEFDVNRNAVFERLRWMQAKGILQITPKISRGIKVL